MSRSWEHTGASRFSSSIAQRKRSAFSEKHDFEMENVFEVQDEIGHRVVESLQSRFPLACQSLATGTAVTRKRYDEFMSGLRESYSQTSRKHLQSAIEHLSRAPSSATPNLLWHTPRCPMYRMQHVLRIRPAAHLAGEGGTPLPRALTLDPAFPRDIWPGH